MLNPSEEFFSKFKTLIKKLPTSNEEELLKSIKNVFGMFHTQDLIGYIRHALLSIENA